MNRTVISVLICLFVFGPATSAATPEQASVAQIDPDNVVLQITVHDDGDATWLVEYRIRLDTENRTEAFESLKDDIEADPASYRGVFADRIRRTIAQAENETGRSMALRNVTVDTHREELQNFGVIRYRFMWTNFGVHDEDRILVGDAISGLFVDRDTTLIIRWPSRYTVHSVMPQPDKVRENELVWTGPIDFNPDEPRLTLKLADEATGTTAGETTSPDIGSSPPLLPALVGLVLVGAAVTAAVMARRKGLWDGTTPLVDPLMSDEEQVIALLEANDGRLKQQRIATEFDWTDTKTSRVVGALREQGRVETFRIGRENAVTLIDDDD